MNNIIIDKGTKKTISNLQHIENTYSLNEFIYIKEKIEIDSFSKREKINIELVPQDEKHKKYGFPYICNVSKLTESLKYQEFEKIYPLLKNSFPSISNLEKYLNNSDYAIYWVDGSNNLIFNNEFELEPRRYRFDYIGTVFNSRECKDLKKFKEYLLSRKDIVEISDIMKIPYYNNNTGSDTYFTVTIYPEKEKYNKIYRHFIDKKEKYPCSRTKDVLCGIHRNFIDYLNFEPFKREIEDD